MQANSEPVKQKVSDRDVEELMERRRLKRLRSGLRR